MKAILTREMTTDEGTFGTLTLSRGGHFMSLATLELPWKNNQRNISCIPEGVYKTILVASPRFGRVYGVQDVPNRSSILIHAGNFAGDTSKGYRSDVAGCILVGLRQGSLFNQRALMDSKAALSAMLSWCNGMWFELTIGSVQK
jgi:hypothetical protein